MCGPTSSPNVCSSTYLPNILFSFILQEMSGSYDDDIIFLKVDSTESPVSYKCENIFIIYGRNNSLPFTPSHFYSTQNYCMILLNLSHVLLNVSTEPQVHVPF